MSSVIKTVTPFINKEMLLEALKAIGCKYTVQGDTIITDRHDYNGTQRFMLKQGRFVFVHDSGRWGDIDRAKYKTVSSFLGAVGDEYNAIHKRRLEELERRRLAAIAEAERLRSEQLAEQERLKLLAQAEEERKRAEEEKIRLEQERKEFVEKQRAAIVAKAKEQGYDVRETVVDNKIKLVLVHTSY